MNNHDIHISWSDVTIIYANGNENSGRLADMKCVDPMKEINRLECEPEYSAWWKRTYKETVKNTIQYYKVLQEYMNSHPEYYGCSD